MAQSDLPIVLITGATGRVGSLLRKAWAATPPHEFQPLWSGRSADRPEGWVLWDMQGDCLPAIAPPLAAILHLARSPGHNGDDKLDVHMTRQAVRLARQYDVPLLIASSVAVYGSSSASLGEWTRPHPQTANGRSKLSVEREFAETPRTCFLRIGNVVGADALIGAGGDRLVLDKGKGSERGPLRSWIGPRTLAAAVCDLLALAVRGWDLPRHLNVAQEPALSMADLAEGDGRRWLCSGRLAEVSCVRLDCGLLRSTLGRALAPADAAGLVAEWRSLKVVRA